MHLQGRHHRYRRIVATTLSKRHALCGLHESKPDPVRAADSQSTPSWQSDVDAGDAHGPFSPTATLGDNVVAANNLARRYAPDVITLF